MVQEGLLTTHPGVDHGDVEASRSQSSLQHGAGTASPGDPEIGAASAVEQWTKSRNGEILDGFCTKG